MGYPNWSFVAESQGMSDYDETPEEQAEIVTELLSRYLGVAPHMFDDPKIQADIADICEMIRGSAYHA